MAGHCFVDISRSLDRVLIPILTGTQVEEKKGEKIRVKPVFIGPLGSLCAVSGSYMSAWRRDSLVFVLN